MDPIFKKLNFKAHKEVVILNAPDSFKTNLENMNSITTIQIATEDINQINFFLAFVTEQEKLEEIVKNTVQKFEGDTVIWIAYPKKSSKKYTCNFNRDTGWDVFGQFDMEPVRQVAIDEDWSALRFRKLDFIKKMTRSDSFALSQKAKNRLSKK